MNSNSLSEPFRLWGLEAMIALVVNCNSGVSIDSNLAKRQVIGVAKQQKDSVLT